MKHTEDRACKFLGCLYLLKLIFSHPQAYKLGDKTIIMKQYNGIFTVQFTVQQLADKLMESYLGKMPMPHLEEVQAVASGQSDFVVSPDVEFNCKHYMKDYQHYERLVESIVDCVENSQDSCATIFNALNGWVKFDVPGLREVPKTGRIQLADNREEILAEEVAEYSDQEIQRQLEKTRDEIYSLDSNSNKDSWNEHRYNELKDWENLLSCEWESRHNH